jgi:cation transport ATPase
MTPTAKLTGFRGRPRLRLLALQLATPVVLALSSVSVVANALRLRRFRQVRE